MLVLWINRTRGTRPQHHWYGSGGRRWAGETRDLHQNPDGGRSRSERQKVGHLFTVLKVGGGAWPWPSITFIHGETESRALIYSLKNLIQGGRGWSTLWLLTVVWRGVFVPDLDLLWPFYWRTMFYFKTDLVCSLLVCEYKTITSIVLCHGILDGSLVSNGWWCLRENYKQKDGYIPVLLQSWWILSHKERNSLWGYCKYSVNSVRFHSFLREISSLSPLCAYISTLSLTYCT